MIIQIGFLLITPKRVPKKIPKDMQKAIKRINKKSLTNLKFAKTAYSLVNKRYISPRAEYFRYPIRLFRNKLGTIWHTKGFLPCDKQNYIFKVILIKSNRFSEKDFKTRYTNTIPTPHQYLKIKVNNHWTDVDLWGADHGIPFGQHAGI